MAIAWTSWECEKKEERCSRIAVPRLASRSFRTRAWSPSTLSPRRGCTRHEDSSCNIKVRLTSWERRSIRFFLFFFFLKSKIEIERAWNSIWTNDCTMNLSSRNNESTNFFFRTQACLTYDIFSLRFLWYVMIWSSLHCDVTIEYYGSFFILEPIRITKLHFIVRNFHICN